MKKTLLLVLALMVAQLSFAQLNDMVKKAKSTVTSVTSGDITQEEAGGALKEALNAGVGEAVNFLSVKDGYFKSEYKILLPANTQKVITKLKAVPGFANLEADLTERINRAAEDAAVKARPIFVESIKKMTFKDAMNILMGNPDAATSYLQRTTGDPLYEQFKPVIQESLDKVNARSLWRDAATAYNKLPFVEPTTTELDDYVTNMALKGLFSLIQKKEAAIRSDVSLRNSDLLKKVFAKQDKQSTKRN